MDNTKKLMLAANKHGTTFVGDIDALAVAGAFRFNMG